MMTATPPLYPFLMIPGPTPLPDAVREVMSRPAMGHRSPEFKEVLKRVLPNLKKVFKAEKSEVILYTASATGAIEAALSNVLNAGDTLLVLSCGVFSARWGDMAKSLGINVQTVDVPHGQANTVESLKAALDADTAKEIKAVILVHSETSTGALNPVQAMVEVIRQHGALSIVDTVTGLTADAFDFDGWGVDLAISGSQKGFMMTPGLAFLAVSQKALEAHANVKAPGFYFNFKRNLKAQAEFTTAYTPATHLILSLDVALQLMLSEGLEAMNARHAALKQQVREGVRALGLRLLVENDADASPAVTAVYPPEGLSVDALRKALKQRFNLTVADGQAKLKGNIFRIGHLGHISERDVLMALACLKVVVEEHRTSSL
ncbi:MAG: pyridoxal-phosphate-dependent aminotransferase family protein [Vampirovibrionales bacterium]